MRESIFCIKTKLTPLEVHNRLKSATLDLSSQRQTNYQQIFDGKVYEDNAEIFNHETSTRNRYKYNLKFASNNDLTIIKISNNKFEIRQFTGALLKALIFPIAVIILILSIVYFDNWTSFSIMAIICIVISLFCFSYKPIPLTVDEFKNDFVPNRLMTILEANETYLET